MFKGKEIMYRWKRPLHDLQYWFYALKCLNTNEIYITNVHVSFLGEIQMYSIL